jgi:hypothetical protein
MSPRTVEQRLRLFLLAIAACIALGTPVELWLMEHYADPAQLIPFALCGLAVVAIGALLLRPSRATIWALRLVMGLALAGSLFGVIEHLEANWEVVAEVTPNAPVGEALLAALRGASPVLASGILGLMALLAIAATYAHPAIVRRTDP